MLSKLTNIDLLPNPYLVTGPLKIDNIKTILKTLEIQFSGKVRENRLDEGVYAFTEPYSNSIGTSNEGLYYYNFTLKTSPFIYQPMGATDINNFNNIQLNLQLINPPKNPDAVTKVVVRNQIDRDIILELNSNEPLFIFDYTLYLMEEKYMILTFDEGNIDIDFLT